MTTISRLEAELADVKKLNKILEKEKISLRYRMKAAYRRMQLAQDQLKRLRAETQQGNDMQDIIFVGKDSTHTIPPIIINTTCCASEDLQGLIYRIEAGDTPGTRELIAILEDIHHNMKEDRI